MRLFSWAIPFAFVGYAWCKSHVKELVYSNNDGKAGQQGGGGVEICLKI